MWLKNPESRDSGFQNLPEDRAVEKLQIKPRLPSFGVLKRVLGGEHLEGFRSATYDRRDF